TVRKGGEDGVIAKIAQLAEEKVITEVSDVKDLSSDKNGMRLLIELKRDADPQIALNKLYKHTPLQTTFGVNMVALVDNVPRRLTKKAAAGAPSGERAAHDADRRAPRDPRRRVARLRGREGGAPRGQGPVRRRAAHGDPAPRGRHRPRGADPGRAGPDLDHE